MIGARLFHRILLCGVISAIVMAGAPAVASPVWVTGGFTSFSGVVGDDGQFHTFINGDVCPDAGCDTGLGVANLVFPTPAGQVDFIVTDAFSPTVPNQLRFTPAPAQDVAKGQEFLLGTLTYTNGIWFSDPEFGFTLTSQSSDPSFAGFQFIDLVHLFITPNRTTNSPQRNADFIYLKNHPELGSVRAYEATDSPSGSNTVTVDVYGAINSLDLVRFANAQGGGFTNKSITAVPSVPEPGIIALLGVGFAAAAASRRRTRTTS